MRFFNTNELKPVPLQEFMEAVEAGRTRVREGMDLDLQSMEAGEPIPDPDKFRKEQAADNMTSRMLGIMQYFPNDEELGFSCEFRRSYVMKLVTKRCFRRYRRHHESGMVDVHEAFLKAVCGMRLTHSMLRHPRRLKHALAREVRRQVEIEKREEAL